MFHPLEAILECLGDREDVRLAAQRLIAIRAGRTQTIPLEDLMKQHGVEDIARGSKGSN